MLYVHRNRRLIRDGSPGRPPRLSHSPELCTPLKPRFQLRHPFSKEGCRKPALEIWQPLLAKIWLLQLLQGKGCDLSQPCWAADVGVTVTQPPTLPAGLAFCHPSSKEGCRKPVLGAWRPLWTKFRSYASTALTLLYIRDCLVMEHVLPAVACYL